MPNMQGFTYIDLAVLIVYLLAVLFAGLHFAKKEMKGKEYFKGDGTVPWWVTSVSIFATLLSPISFLSLAGNSYEMCIRDRPHPQSCSAMAEAMLVLVMMPATCSPSPSTTR